MTAPLSSLPTAATGNSLAADSHSLDQLRALASQDPAKAIKQVSTQFEALFMQMVLKSMREATPKSGMFDSPEEETYTGMLDEQIAQKIAAGGTGLGDVIAKQLSANLPHPVPAATATTAQPAGLPAATTATAQPAGLPAEAPANAGAKAGATLLQSIRAARAARGGS
jgi:peptidoglycan hydrolase FlgJ